MYDYLEEREQKKTYFSFFLFVLWPLLGFLFSLSLRKSKIKLILFCLFFALIGYSFLLTNETIDSFRYAQDFQTYCRFGVSEFLEYRREANTFDLYTIISFWFVSLFSSNSHLLFAFYGLIFGLFIYFSFTLILKFNCNHVHISSFIILIIIYCMNPHLNINGVRFWTAAWIFFVSCLLYFKNKKLLGTLLLVFLPFVHNSFLIFLIFIPCYLLMRHLSLGKLLLIYLTCTIFSLIVDFSYIQNLFSFIGSSSHYSIYLDNEFVDNASNMANTRSNLNVLLTSLPKIFIPFFLIYIYSLIRQYIYKNEFITEFMSFILTYFSLFNILSSIPSMSRFVMIGYMLFLFFIYLLVCNNYILPSITCCVILVVFAGNIYLNFYWASSAISSLYLLPSVFYVI